MKIFEHLLERPELTKYNFMGACEPWKMEWTSESHKYGWIRAFPKSLKGRCRYMLRYGWKNFLGRSAAVRKLKTNLAQKRKRHAL
jgi:hypothetical protein